MPQVSVIIPVYGVEQFIVRCAESLMRQTLGDVEFIFVDDASPDGSIGKLREVVGKYPWRNVKVLTHDVNKGLPAARNMGLAVATGDYVFHCDSDDYLEADALEVLYRKAMEEEADIVWCDYFLDYPNGKRLLRQPSHATAEEALRAMLRGTMKYNVWNKLARRSLYTDNAITFPAGYAMGEDLTMVKLFALAHKVAYVGRGLYHYEQGNLSALTKAMASAQMESLRRNCDDVIAFMRRQRGAACEPTLRSFMLLMKWPFLCTSKRSLWREWERWYPEANAHIWEDKGVTLRIRAVEWCAARGWFALVWLHYWVVLRFLYRIIYK